MPKINANCLSQRDYEQKMTFFHQKKQSQFKANPEQSRGMNISSFITKYYENIPLSEAKKTKPNQTQFPQGQVQRARNIRMKTDDV